MTSSLRDTLHLILAVPILIGMAVALFLFSQSSQSELTEDSFGGSAVAVWADIASEIPADMPGEYASFDAEEDGPASTSDLSLEERELYARNNAFLLSCSLLVLLGTLGTGLTGAGGTLGEPRWNPLLRVGAIVATGLIAFLLWGFQTAFPGDHVGIFPLPALGFPGSMDAVEYGLGGVSEWADLLYTATYGAFLGCLLLTFANARLTALSVFLIALPVSTIFFPVVVSWLWGAGWLDAIGQSFDFAGAALLHWHAGASALLLGGLATLFRRKRVTGPDATEEKPLLLAWFVPGALAYFLGMIGLNVGSTLESTALLNAAVLQGMLTAAVVSALLALAWLLVAKSLGSGTTRSLPEFFLFGAIAGTVSVSAAADSLTFLQSIGFGAAAGILVPGAILWMDKANWIDPLAIGAVHGIGSVIALLGTLAIPLGEDYAATMLGQLLLLITVPLPALLLTGFVILIAGTTGLLFTDRGTPAPPPLPRSS